MLWTIFMVLAILWVLGMVTSYTIGGFIHLLLLMALVALLIAAARGNPDLYRLDPSACGPARPGSGRTNHRR